MALSFELHTAALGSMLHAFGFNASGIASGGELSFDLRTVALGFRVHVLGFNASSIASGGGLTFELLTAAAMCSTVGIGLCVRGFRFFSPAAGSQAGRQDFRPHAGSSQQHSFEDYSGHHSGSAGCWAGHSGSAALLCPLGGRCGTAGHGSRMQGLGFRS